VAIPVVDSGHRLLGVITVDDIIDVIREEATEDIQRLGGAAGDETVLDPARVVFPHRRLRVLLLPRSGHPPHPIPPLVRAAKVRFTLAACKNV
jgi:Mg/Co/Ni transporter MgtE